ncbi:MAG: HAMP domain-containing histidine kinase [Anaerolineae bacterium]|nr:HAMP domain-containing histidine kinase [Anaerolineae bacterium]
MSIRSRLTVFYSVILCVSLGVFGVVLYLTMAHSTRTFMENTLAAEMQRLNENHVQSLAYIQWPNPTTGMDNTYWQACDSKGNVMGRTDNLKDHNLPLSDDGLRQIQNGQAIYEVAQVDSASMLVYSQPVNSENGIIGILQVARSVAEQEQALATLQTALVVGGMLTLILATGGGWLMAGMSLRPIDHLTRTAQQIGNERNFDRRVKYHGPQDEVGRLATTFNGMLAALESAYQHVTQALEAQRSFIADASHELRTPLATLRGNIALLQREPPIAPDDRKAVLSDIVDENERMIRLVNDLMTLARAEYAPDVKLESVSLDSLFAEIERQARGLHPSCTFRVGYLTNLQVKANRDTLKQVLLILLDNAFKFTPAHGQVELCAEQCGNHVQIRVRDTGVGINHENVAHIFQRFYRVEQARNGTGGYGLGLAIAKALVEKQQGTIQAESRSGFGSTFTVTLYGDETMTPTAYQPQDHLVRTYSYAK